MKTLYEWRQERRIRPEVLAVLMEVSVRTFTSYERGESIPRVDAARKVADFLGIPETDIAWGVKPPADAEGKVNPVEAA